MEETEKRIDQLEKIDLIELLMSGWKRFREIWWILILLVILCMGAMLWKEKKNYSPSYAATASFIVSAGQDDGSSLSSYYNKITVDQLNATFPYILTSGLLNEVVANDMEVSSVPGSISASVLEETNLFQIQVTSQTAGQAYEVLQSVIKNYPAVARYVVGDTTLKLIDESGIPKNPTTRPDWKRAAFKGILLGLMLDAAILFLLVILRKTIRNQDDLKKITNVPYLAGIPLEKRKKRSASQGMKNRNTKLTGKSGTTNGKSGKIGNVGKTETKAGKAGNAGKIRKTGQTGGSAGSLLLTSPSISYSFREAIHALQIRTCRILQQKGIKTLMVTSTLAGEGKTMVSCNLACAMAEKGYKVLLLDLDFRNPSVGAAFGIQNADQAITDVLKGNIPAKKVLRQVGDTSLWILPGSNVAESSENVANLYQNGNLKKLIRQYQEDMDVILLDTPPGALLNDAFLAADNAQGILFVIRQDYVRRDKILEGMEILSESNADLIGCVINGEDTGIGSYGYGKYGYGKYGYGRYGYGKYGHSRYGYGYGYGAEKEK